MFASVKVPSESPGSPQWWQARLRGDHQRNRLPRANGITLERIAEATLAVIERDGLERVSMRRVALELDTGPASLYRHVASRDELLVIVADELIGTLSLDAVPPGEDWRRRTEDYARQFRSALVASPALRQLVTHAQLLGPNALRARETALADLLAAGFAPALAVRTYLAVTHYVIGAVQLDDRSTKHHGYDRRALQTLFRSLEPATYPTVHALGGELGGLHPDDEFEFGLHALLDGIAAMRP